MRVFKIKSESKQRLNVAVKVRMLSNYIFNALSETTFIFTLKLQQ